MSTIRSRFDYICFLKTSGADAFFVAEHAAFHGRKIIEGIAFGCMVSTENGLKNIPRDAKGQWAADKIIKALKNRGVLSFPSPSIIRAATEEERKEHGNISATIAGQPHLRISVDEMCKIYERFHKWAHEISPYVDVEREAFLSKHQQQLWKDLLKIELFIEKHFISIKGEGMFCVLKDSVDGMVKVIPLSKATVNL